MRLMKLSQYRRWMYAEGSAPCMNTLRKRVECGAIPGGRVEHGHYYVDLDENDRANKVRDSIDEKQRAVAPLLEGLI